MTYARILATSIVLSFLPGCGSIHHHVSRDSPVTDWEMVNNVTRSRDARLTLVTGHQLLVNDIELRPDTSSFIGTDPDVRLQIVTEQIGGVYVLERRRNPILLGAGGILCGGIIGTLIGSVGSSDPESDTNGTERLGATIGGASFGSLVGGLVGIGASMQHDSIYLQSDPEPTAHEPSFPTPDAGNPPASPQRTDPIQGDTISAVGRIVLGGGLATEVSNEGWIISNINVGLGFSLGTLEVIPNVQFGYGSYRQIVPEWSIWDGSTFKGNSSILFSNILLNQGGDRFRVFVQGGYGHERFSVKKRQQLFGSESEWVHRSDWNYGFESPRDCRRLSLWTWHLVKSEAGGRVGAPPFGPASSGALRCLSRKRAAFPVEEP